MSRCNTGLSRVGDSSLGMAADHRSGLKEARSRKSFLKAPEGSCGRSQVDNNPRVQVKNNEGSDGRREVRREHSRTHSRN